MKMFTLEFMDIYFYHKLKQIFRNMLRSNSSQHLCVTSNSQWMNGLWVVW